MKKMLFGLFCLAATLPVFAQEKFAPAIKQGSKLHYTVSSGGQDIPCTFSFDSVTADYVKVGWVIEGLGTGSWVIKNKALENAVRGYWEQPAPGVREELPDDQSVLLFSKAQWIALQKDKKINFDQQTYTLKEPSSQQQLKLAGKNVDAFLLENQSGTARIWILNNAAFPILLKTEGNPMGPEIAISSVE